MYLLAVIIMLSSLILGGGTSHGFLSDAILQFIAILVILVSLWQMPKISASKQAWIACFFCLVVLSVPLFQLISLPPEIWTAFPGREKLVSALSLSFNPLPWMPLSMSPRSTWLSFLAMLPPLAIFLTVHQLNHQDRQRLALVIVIFGIFSVFLGFLQLVQGSGSSLRFFEFTNRDDSVGFFANRNHYAASLYSIFMLAIALLMIQMKKWDGQPQDKRVNTSKLLYVIMGLTVVVIFMVGQLMTRSRSGLGLTILAFVGIYFMGRAAGRRKRKRKSSKSIKVIWLILSLIVLFSSQFALFRIMDRFEPANSDKYRQAFYQITKAAAWENMPYGTGLGSFVPVFKQYETTNIAVPGRTFVNHAHNDYLEIWLETGLVSLFIIGMFAIWFLSQIYRVWISSRGEEHIPRSPLVQAATIIISLLLIHSFASYPLRTTAMMGVFAFACALLIPSPEKNVPKGGTL